MDERIKHLLRQGREYYVNREYDRAENLLTQVLRENRGFADVYNMLGVIYHDQGRFPQAQECFEQALAINPAYTEAALNLAVTYNELGKYNDAKRVYGQAMARTKNQPRSLDTYAKGKLANMHADLADAYHGIGLFQEALREYREGLGLCPTFVDIRTKLANALRDMGRIEEAIVEYREVLETNSQFVHGRLQLGVTLYGAGRIDEAIAEWRRALEIDPDSRNAKAYLKMVSADDSPDAEGEGQPKPASVGSGGE